MGSAYYDSTGVSPEKRKDDLQVLSLCTWAFVRSMKRHLSPADEDEEDFRTELLEKLPGPQALKIIRDRLPASSSLDRSDACPAM